MVTLDALLLGIDLRGTSDSTNGSLADEGKRQCQAAGSLLSDTAIITIGRQDVIGQKRMNIAISVRVQCAPNSRRLRVTMMMMIYHLYSPLQGQAMERFYSHRLLIYCLQSNHSP